MPLNLETRPQPVLFCQFLTVIAAVAVLLIVVVAVTQVSSDNLKVIATIVGCLVTLASSALFGVPLANKVTPVDDPQNDAGVPLVPKQAGS